MPITPGQISDTDISEFAELMAGNRGPILAYCRTGNRSSTLWALAESAHITPEVLLEATKAVGYDLSGQHERMQQRFAESGAEAPYAPARTTISSRCL